MTDDSALTLTTAQAGYLVEVIDYWLEDMADVPDQDDPTDVAFLTFIRDLRAQLAERTT